MESSPSFVRAPERNVAAERFIRALKEQLLWVRTFDTVEEIRQALLESKERFNEHRLLEGHGYAPQVRAASVPLEKAA
ncbi:integrase core domain-containing protein [Desulfacinum infernum]|uniref:integrase core domain-containing protein n=1 Tax=Desulfacinum infernum TaxID=35837 RepID=UPI000A036836